MPAARFIAPELANAAAATMATNSNSTQAEVKNFITHPQTLLLARAGKFSMVYRQTNCRAVRRPDMRDRFGPHLLS
jgi:hypothetical protein